MMQILKSTGQEITYILVNRETKTVVDTFRTRSEFPARDVKEHWKARDTSLYHIFIHVGGQESF